MPLYRQIGSKVGIAMCVASAAEFSHARGQHMQAARLFGAVDEATATRP